MATLEKIKCEICGKEISKRNINRHIKTCSYIYKNKDLLIKDYHNLRSINKVAKKHHINPVVLSDKYKEWNIKTMITKNGKYLRIYNVNDNFFDEMSHIQYWLIGLFAADGCIDGHYITISQSGDNGLKLIKYIKKLISHEGNIRVVKTPRKPAYSIYFSSSKIADKLSEFGVVKNKTKMFNMPKNIPHEYIASFIAGYIEGDGSIGVYNVGYSSDYLKISFVGNRCFVEDFNKLSPIKGTINKHSQSDVYTVEWNGLNAIKFGDWIYKDENIYHSYKYDKYLHGKEMRYNSKKAVYKRKKDEFNSYLINNDMLYKPLNAKEAKRYGKSQGVGWQTLYKWKKELETEMKNNEKDND